MPTIDPTTIQSPSQIPPPGSQFAGTTPQGLVDVYFGTIAGDTDASPAAAELLATAPGTGGLVNAEYIYTQVAKLFGGVQLPTLQSPSGNNVQSVIFVSGSPSGGFGAFHIPTNQTDFDRIVVDSLNAAGNYSAGSGLPGAAALTPARNIPNLFPKFTGDHHLMTVLDENEQALRSAPPEAIRKGLAIATQSLAALKAATASQKASTLPHQLTAADAHATSHLQHGDMARRLAQMNRDASGLMSALAVAGGRQFLSTALFAAEIVESFALLTGKSNSGQTDGEAVSRVLGFKLAPEIALVPGFNSGVTQQWWSDGHPDFANDNSQNDQSADGNAAGVMFLLFLTDFLGVPVDTILAHMPAVGGAPLGQTYTALLADNPGLSAIAGADGNAAFQAMVTLLQQNSLNPDGTLNLPADGNPFPAMPNAKQGGLFAQ